MLTGFLMHENILHVSTISLPSPWENIEVGIITCVERVSRWILSRGRNRPRTNILPDNQKDIAAFECPFEKEFSLFGLNFIP